MFNEPRLTIFNYVDIEPRLPYSITRIAQDFVDALGYKYKGLFNTIIVARQK